MPLGCPRALKWAARAPLEHHLGAQVGRSGATWAPKGTQIGCSGATWVPKGAQMGCSGTTWALEWAARAALECPRALKWALRSKPLCVRSHCCARSHCALEATVRSKPQLRSKPLCVRSHCSKSPFEITVRDSCLGTTVLCFTSLCLTEHGSMPYFPGLGGGWSFDGLFGKRVPPLDSNCQGGLFWFCHSGP